MYDQYLKQPTNKQTYKQSNKHKILQKKTTWCTMVIEVGRLKRESKFIPTPNNNNNNQGTYMALKCQNDTIQSELTGSHSQTLAKYTKNNMLTVHAPHTLIPFPKTIVHSLCWYPRATRWTHVDRRQTSYLRCNQMTNHRNPKVDAGKEETKAKIYV